VTASFNILQTYYLLSCAKYHSGTRFDLAIIIGVVQTVAGATSESVLGVQRPDPYLFTPKAAISY
jgi:hypothetical protein